MTWNALTWLMVRVQTLENTVVAFKRIRPPAMNGTEQRETLCEVQRQVMVRYKWMVQEFTKSFQVGMHVTIVSCRPRVGHRSTGSEVDGDDEARLQSSATARHLPASSQVANRMFPGSPGRGTHH